MKDKTSKGHRQRLKERFLKGDNCFSDEESLLELLLTYSIPRKDVQPLAKSLIAHFGNIADVLNASVEELCKIKDINSNSAALIKVVKRISSESMVAKIATETTKTKPLGPKQRSLFDMVEPISQAAPSDKSMIQPKTRKPFRKRGIELFANALMKETISVLPDLLDTDSIDTARQTIQDSLHFSAETTRRRNSLYILQRMFPKGFVDRPLRLFANHFRTRDELNEVCFYRFLRAEPLLGKLIDELIIPNIGVGYIGRERIKDFLEKLFPESKSIKHGTKAILDALIFGGLAKLNGKKVIFSYRNIPFASVVFVLFSEFPEPGMYELNKMENNPFIIRMLWKPDQILILTYELRNRGFISKISEIDNFRQFTTKLSLEQSIERLIALDKKIERY